MNFIKNCCNYPSHKDSINTKETVQLKYKETVKLKYKKMVQLNSRKECS